MLTHVDVIMIGVSGWSPREVGEWVKGLPGSLSVYASSFVTHRVSGCVLLGLVGGDLVKYGVNRVGDQLLFEEALQGLRWECEMGGVTLQTLSSSLAVRCRTYRSELSSIVNRSNYIPTESLSSASFLLDGAKSLVRWMVRYPFAGQGQYDLVLQEIVKHCFELGMGSQRGEFADNVIEEVQYLCTKIIELCELLVHGKDSLVIQPAYIDYVTIRKRSEQEIGLQVETSVAFGGGVHVVTGVKMSSPAQQSGHVEKGDEIVAVNNQIVLWWVSIVELLLENPVEVTLTVKRRPRHATANILLPHNMYHHHHHHHHLRPSSAVTSSSSKKMSLRNSSSSGNNNKPISPVIEKIDDDDGDEDDEDSSSAATTTTTTTTTTTEGGGVVVVVKEEEEEDSASVSEVVVVTTSGCGFGGRARFEASMLLRSRSSSSSKIRRRATVTGASPTSSRPPVTFTQEDQGEESVLLPPPQLQTLEDGGGRLLGVQMMRAPLVSWRSAPNSESPAVGVVDAPPVEGVLRKQGNVQEEEGEEGEGEEEDVHVGVLHVRRGNGGVPLRWVRDDRARVVSRKKQQGVGDGDDGKGGAGGGGLVLRVGGADVEVGEVSILGGGGGVAGAGGGAAGGGGPPLQTTNRPFAMRIVGRRRRKLKTEKEEEGEESVLVSCESLVELGAWSRALGCAQPDEATAVIGPPKSVSRVYKRSVSLGGAGSRSGCGRRSEWFSNCSSRVEQPHPPFPAPAQSSTVTTSSTSFGSSRNISSITISSSAVNKTCSSPAASAPLCSSLPGSPKTMSSSSSSTLPAMGVAAKLRQQQQMFFGGVSSSTVMKTPPPPWTPPPVPPATTATTAMMIDEETQTTECNNGGLLSVNNEERLVLILGDDGDCEVVL